MNVVIRKNGNCERVFIPKEVLQRLGLKNGDALEIREVNGNIELVPERADLAEQLRAVRLGMQKYRAPLRELAK
ncbi:AbrB/MazE/SpoVT family DNA-binding domain-containing protein [Rhizobium calliandrae]|uniref:AbrB/MazE/SpoVT family DNA-binding domain-containing protein n=1 Tax=Rhizobium calliandrae TaxID=1312182 RepID=A0ABT7K7J1_9HYPH|nr:AbrB/MazE/SpoVT family DNA-binding domain-containing protein [Rhizobium calliandrae]MDL2404571.1 AbrB/MazE/SpoVT family DNA-binding domain-containing protein [Rhizobium calliandrae]